jgi:hypothetical protein
MSSSSSPFILPVLASNDLLYGTDKGYRNVIRRIVGMDTTKHSVTSGIDYSALDEITRDEVAYDDNAMMDFMTSVWTHTKHNTDLCELYQTAAGAMFSTDPEIGIVVLFAYDYLPPFYPILLAFSQNPQMEVDTHPNYNALLQMFSRR